MDLTLIWAALTFALLDWFAVAQGWKILGYIAKPAVMMCLIAWLGVVSGWSGPLLWFTAGLVFSLAGDIFLMLPKGQFIAGLASFLLAHISYVIGLNTTPLPINWVTLILLIIVGVVSTRLYSRISPGLKTSGDSKLLFPVQVYTIAISLMLFSALLAFLRPSWSPGAALLVGLGAVLFYCSDSLIAWNKFVNPLKYGELMVIITYQTGQVLITLGAALNLVS
jgi:uncharacterized membrane protein YhhN